MVVTSSRYLHWLSRALARRATPSHAEGDLVLGYATGYGAADIEPFVRSLRAVYGGEIILTVDGRPDVRELLAAFDIAAAEPPSPSPWSPHPVVERFAFYEARLRGRTGGNVLLIDVRDVIFQADPFGNASGRLEVYTESMGSPLGRHAFNMKHLRAIAGAALAESLADRPCICVGAVMGPARETARFCRLLLMLAAVPRSEVGGAFGADQAACNIAVHADLIDVAIEPNYARVATIGDVPGEDFRIEDGLILNPGGGFSPIVHQYDRHAHLADWVRERWGRPQHCIIGARRKPAAQRLARLQTSLRRRLPEMR